MVKTNEYDKGEFKSFRTKIRILVSFYEINPLVKGLQSVYNEKYKGKLERKEKKEWSEESIINSINNYLSRDTKTMKPDTLDLWARALDMKDDLFKIPLKQFIDQLYPTPTLSIARDKGEILLDGLQKKFEGYHYGWFEWPNDADNGGKFYKTIIHCKDIVKMKKLITIEMMTERFLEQFSTDAEWGFKGRMLPLATTHGASLYLEGHNKITDMVSVISILLANGDPEKGIWGIYTAIPSVSDKYRSVPCASKFYMKKALIVDGKARTEKELLKNIGWQDLSELKKDTGLKDFTNELNKYGVLESNPRL